MNGLRICVAAGSTTRAPYWPRFCAMAGKWWSWVNTVRSSLSAYQRSWIVWPRRPCEPFGPVPTGL